ncbi:REP-associated tyrosine transposase [Pseudomonas nicosulfuronedens]
MGFHGKDLRNGRHSIPGQIYLVTTVANQREQIFNEWSSAQAAAREIHSFPQHAPAEIHAWVLMPDHLHCLIVLDEMNLDSCMQQLKSRTAIALNRSTGRSGKVWQSGYHDHALRRDEDLKAAARYLVANPIRAGLVRSVREYPFWNAIWL